MPGPSEESTAQSASALGSWYQGIIEALPLGVSHFGDRASLGQGSHYGLDIVLLVHSALGRLEPAELL